MNIEKYINTVNCIDNLEFMRSLPDNSIDLIYGDILFNTGKKFKDYDDNLGTPQEAMEFYKPRLIEMYRILKNTGSIYIHCDWHLDSYIRVELDNIFGYKNFRNEIIWERSKDTGSSKSKANKLPICNDIILFYTKSNDYLFSMPTIPYDEKLLKRYKLNDNDGKGKYYWADLRTYSDKRLKELQEKNEIKQRKSGKYSYKRYLNNSITKKALSNIWLDINRVSSSSNECLDYNTQKPEELLRRIIKESSNPEDIVLDCFCGSGTTGKIAKELNRNYILCDINPRACEISKNRLKIIGGEDIAL